MHMHTDPPSLHLLPLPCAALWLADYSMSDVQGEIDKRKLKAAAAGPGIITIYNGEGPGKGGCSGKGWGQGGRRGSVCQSRQPTGQSADCEGPVCCCLWLCWQLQQIDHVCLPPRLHPATADYSMTDM